MLDSGYTAAWGIWIALFVAIEGKAILNSKKGDTLSEHIWSWFNIDKRESNWTGKRIALLGSLVWLVGHLVWRVV